MIAPWLEPEVDGALARRPADFDTVDPRGGTQAEQQAHIL